MKKISKILKAFLIFILFFFLFSNSSKAVEEPEGSFGGSGSLEKFQQNLKNCDEFNTTSMECWIGGPEQVAEEPDKAATGVMPAITNSLTTMIIGPLATPDDQAYRPGGAIGGITNLIAILYANPPASSVEYFADLGRNLKIIKPVYAQGTGFEGLSPILPIWKNFRNLAYLFFVILFTIIGFAIMFRLKLNPQTVISIQSAIPRIVLALILVTFSYAIAGLLIDLMNVLTVLIIAAIDPKGHLIEITIELLGIKLGNIDLINVKSALSNLNIVSLIAFFIKEGGSAASRLGQIFNPVTWIPGFAGEVLERLPLLKGLTGGFSGLATLILAIGLLWAFFKLFFSLLMAYVRIIIGIIFAPLQIMLGALPGIGGFGNWLRNIVSNIAVFPAVVIMIALASTILDLTKADGKMWTPPALYPLSPSGEFIGALIVYGMLLMTPKVADMVKEALQVKPFPYGAAIGEAFGPIKKLGGPASTLGKVRWVEQLAPEDIAAEEAPRAPWTYIVYKTVRGLKKPTAP